MPKDRNGSFIILTYFFRKCIAGIIQIIVNRFIKSIATTENSNVFIRSGVINTILKNEYGAIGVWAKPWRINCSNFDDRNHSFICCVACQIKWSFAFIFYNS
ncbi:hypothetical protein CWC45_08890 [Neisseria sp. N177_16]|nr:hypothetical protein CWC45_08890 [Neisseria sp. N177_16]